jgi:hypothetical protein
MRRGFQEKLRLLTALLCLLILAGIADASLIPSGVDVWFSTSTYAIAFGGPVTPLIAPDNLFNMSGKRIFSNGDLLQKYGPARWFMSFGQGLDALTMVKEPGASAAVPWFSTGRTFYSNTYGRNIDEGDLLSRNGNIVATNQALLAKFSPSTTASAGLDGVDVINPGPGQEIWFTTRSNFYSKALSKQVTSGDLLSNSGQIIATNADLLAAFEPSKPGNYGLDAMHVVSMQQGKTPVIWFSTNMDFYSNALKRTVGQGDILSNAGQVIATNAELMRNFGWHFPANPGLDVIAFGPQKAAVNISRAITEQVSAKTAAPEPATIGLLAAGMAAGGVVRRRRN